MKVVDYTICQGKIFCYIHLGPRKKISVRVDVSNTKIFSLVKAYIHFYVSMFLINCLQTFVLHFLYCYTYNHFSFLKKLVFEFYILLLSSFCSIYKTCWKVSKFGNWNMEKVIHRLMCYVFSMQFVPYLLSTDKTTSFFTQQIEMSKLY